MKKFILGVVSVVAMTLSAVASAAVSVETITWNVIGLDSNKPNETQPNPGVYPPDTFPVGVRVCADTELAAGWYTDFIWESTDANLYLTDSAHPTVNPPTAQPDYHTDLRTLTFSEALPAGECRDVYYQVSAYRDPSAYNISAKYRIDVRDNGNALQACTPTETNGGVVETIDCNAGLPAIPGAVSTVDTGARELYVEYLVSQNRNQVDGYYYNGVFVPTIADAASPTDAMITVQLGQVFTLRLDAHTATQGYEQLEAFVNLPPDLFEVLSVSSTYSAAAGTDAGAASRLYADGCNWVDDPNSSRYLNNESCLSVGKYGGTITKTYEIKVIGTPSDLNDNGSTNAPGLLTAQTMIYDFSGSSFHYNSDFSDGSGGLFINWGTPTASADLSIFKGAYVDKGGNTFPKADLTKPLTEFSSNKPFIFRLTVTNNSANAATSVVVTDTLAPAYRQSENFYKEVSGDTVAYDSDPLSPTYGEIIWTFGTDLVGSGTRSLDVAVNGNVTDDNNYDNTACVTSDEDPDSSNNCYTIRLTPPNPVSSPDLAISKVVDKKLTVIGEQVVFTLTAKNLDASVDATNVIVSDTLPNGYQFLSTDRPAEVTGPDSSGLIEWDIGALAAGATEELKITVKVLGGTGTYEYLNVSTITSTTSGFGDPTPENNRATASAEPSFLKITKTSASSFIEGGVGTFSLQVEKKGNLDTLDTLYVTDPLPMGLTVKTTPVGTTPAGSGGWDCTATVIGSTNISCFIPDGDYTSDGSVANDANGVPTYTYEAITFDVDVANPVALDNLINVAQVISKDGRHFYDDDYKFPVADAGALLAPSLTKTFSPDVLVSGGSPNQSTLTIVISNPNASPLTQVSLTDNLPSGMTLAGNATTDCPSATASGVIGGTSLSVSSFTLPASPATCKLEALVTATVVGDYVNTTEPINYNDGTDPVTGNKTGGTATDALKVNSAPGSLTGVVFLEGKDFDGIKNGVEPGTDAGGLWACLLPANQSVQVSSVDGSFSFTGLAAGAYSVVLTETDQGGSCPSTSTIPNGYYSTGENNNGTSTDGTADSKISANVPGGGTASVQLGLAQVDIFDPPFGVKKGTLKNGNTLIEWTMVWVNNSPVGATATVTDTLARFAHRFF